MTMTARYKNLGKTCCTGAGKDYLVGSIARQAAYRNHYSTRHVICPTCC